MHRRFEQLALIGLSLGSAWLGMMAVHELGHVLHAAVSGGRVARVVLHPLAFSRTDVSPNPHPLFVAWGGVAWGCIVPVAAWFFLRTARLGFLLQFFAGFCLLANGAYLASGIVMPAGDTEDLIRLGTPRWALAACGVPLSAAGLMMWNGLGPTLGWGGHPVDRRALMTAVVSLIVLTGGMLAWSLLTQARVP